MKFFETVLDEQETTISILYKEQLIRIYSSEYGTIQRLTKVLGRPTIKYKKSKTYWSGASWDVSFFDLDKLKDILYRDTFIDKNLKPIVKEETKKKVKKEKVDDKKNSKEKVKKEVIEKTKKVAKSKETKGKEQKTEENKVRTKTSKKPITEEKRSKELKKQITEENKIRTKTPKKQKTEEKKSKDQKKQITKEEIVKKESKKNKKITQNFEQIQFLF